MGPNVASASLPFHSPPLAHTVSAGTLAQEAATHASESNTGLPATRGDATAPPLTGGAPNAEACWLPTPSPWAAAGTGSAKPPNAVPKAGPPNAFTLVGAAALCAPKKPYEPARFERDASDPAARHDHAPHATPTPAFLHPTP
jgi:hypothetical protein